MKKETYKKVMNKIKLPGERKEEIYENIMSKQRKMSYLKPIFITSIISLVVLVGALGTVYAEEIKEAINTIFIKKVHNEENHTTKLEGNILAEINYDANIPEANPKTLDERRKGNLNQYFTYEELETKLGIPLLKSEYFKRKNLYQELTEKEDGKITRASFNIENFMDTKERVDGNHMFSFYLKTKYLQNQDNSLFSVSGRVTDEQYHISSLDTMAYIFKFHDGYRDQMWKVFVIYQNIIYQFEFNFIRKESNEMWEETIRILESLYL